jgi:hypothetical protein
MPKSPELAVLRTTRGIRIDYRALHNGNEAIDTLDPLHSLLPPTPTIDVLVPREGINTATEFELELPNIYSNSNSQLSILPSNLVSQIKPTSISS